MAARKASACWLLTFPIQLPRVGLGVTVVLHGYIGSIAAVIAGPLVGVALVVAALGTRSLAATLPAALIPAAFLSPTHSGLIVLTILLATLLIYLSSWRKNNNKQAIP